MPQTVLEPTERAFLEGARRATLATTSPSGRPRLVPICFAVGASDDRLGRPRLHSPIDEKPKTSPDPTSLGRVRDLLVLPEATILVDRWSEDWDRLGWIRLDCIGDILDPRGPEQDEHAAAVVALRAKYEQYATHHLEERPMLRFTITRVLAWGDLSTAEEA